MHATPTTVPAPASGFAARLNRLFEVVHAPGERPHTNSEVAAQLTAWGHPISKPYLSQLRSGARTDPSRETIAALARFFRVRSAYFADDAYTTAADRDSELIARLQFHGLRKLSTRAFDLSEESQNLLTAMADRLRVTEGLPEVGGGGVD
ncbi:helix-turn-helix transcriptional regulator [Nocardia sp. NPDC051981]|uniref:helix-turn-helix domain-containing protein n=1 Tax=Nocardia sp. NPDC051981 TaxID=3155417 RepID=UPI0034134039